MATYTPEQIREFTKGMSDKQIAEAAQQFNVSPTQLAGAFNIPREDVTQRAEAAGVPLASTAYEAYQNMQAGGSQDTTMDMLRSSVGMPAPAPSAPPAPPPVAPPEVADITIADSTGAPVTYQYGSQINDQLAEAWTAGSQSGDYTRVNALLNVAGYTLDDVQKQFNIDEDGMAALKAAGITGVSPENSAIAGLWEQITELQAQNQDYSSQVTALNGLLGGIGLTMDDLKSRFALDDDDVQFVESLGVLQPTGPTIQDTMIQRAMQPALPEGGKMVAEGIGFNQATQQIGTGTGQVGEAKLAADPSTADVSQATTPTEMTAATMTAATAASQLQQTTAAVGAVSAPMMAQTMAPTDTQVAQQQAAQLDQAVRVQAPQARQLSAEELVSAPANAQAAATFAEQVQAAQAQPTPEATVQGQLANLMADFEGGETPAWAAGAMRNATAIMAQRGLGASSMAGQAIIQAAMESALPIAMQDAQTVSQFEMQNLSNRQQRAMLAAQQRAQFIGQEFDQEFQARVQNASRISDIANINFNAEQQIALENAQLAQTVDLSNLSNRQAVQMANIAQIAQLEMTNLNNRQQAAVQNAQSFLQMDLTNLSNTQQATMFDAQSRVQALLSDTSAINAARQFNASSENQADQFFANLSSQVSQFNATQSNAMEQFQIEQDSAIEQFNAQIANQRDQFNAQNQLVVAQSNAQWRRDIATLDTAALNEANKMNAESVLDISEQAYANLWQAYEDQMEYAWTTAEKELDRINDLVAIKLQADTNLQVAELKADAQASSGLGSFIGTVASGFLAKQGVIALSGATPVT